MSLVFSSPGCRISAACLLALLAVGCSGSDRIPLAAVGGPQQGDVLLGRVDARRGGRVLVGRVGEVSPEAVAYAPPVTPGNGGSAGIDYLDTPNLASTAPAQPASPDVNQSQTAMAIPEGGVNIDGELGVAYPSGDGTAEGDGESAGVQPQIVTQAGAMAIAEGSPAQPVVDGIGFDEPTEIVTGPRGPGGAHATGGVQATQVAEEMPQEGGILPLSVDSGNSGMGDVVPMTQARVAAAPSPVARDCALYLDKRNCR